MFDELPPRHQKMARLFDKYLVLVAIMACVAIYLQATLIIHNQSSENVSIPAYILLVLISLSWMAYGILWLNWFLSLSGMTMTIGSIIALVAAVSYRPFTTPGAFLEL